MKGGAAYNARQSSRTKKRNDQSRTYVPVLSEAKTGRGYQASAATSDTITITRRRTESENGQLNGQTGAEHRGHLSVQRTPLAVRTSGACGRKGYLRSSGGCARTNERGSSTSRTTKASRPARLWLHEVAVAVTTGNVLDLPTTHTPYSWGVPRSKSHALRLRAAVYLSTCVVCVNVCGKEEGCGHRNHQSGKAATKEAPDSSGRRLALLETDPPNTS